MRSNFLPSGPPFISPACNLIVDLILALISFTAYFLESIFGFGGTIVFVGMGGIFHDFTEILLIGTYVAMVASATVIFQQRREMPWEHLKHLALPFLPGLIIGTVLIDVLASVWLLKMFAIVMIGYGLQSLFFPKFTLPKFLRFSCLVFGGFIQGLFSCGGPFVLMGYRHEFKNKSDLRITMATFFCVTNIWKLVQNSLTTGSALPVVTEFWWLAFPVIASMYAGYWVHKRISEKQFAIGMTIGITLIGCFLLLR